MITFIYVVGIIVLLVSLILMFFLIKNDKLKSLIYKIEMCEEDFDKVLDIKEENVLRLINIIIRELKLEIKSFDKVKNLKSNRVNNIEKDQILSEAYSDIKDIYSDNASLSKVKSFDGIIKDIDTNEIEFISLRTLYNQCVSKFNLMHGKFPYNIICKFKKKSQKPLFEGKELQEVIEKELSNLVI